MLYQINVFIISTDGIKDKKLNSNELIWFLVLGYKDKTKNDKTTAIIFI